jgi:hypothetical protein
MVLAISIVATVSMVRKAQELSTIDKHRRKARGIIDGILEQTTYQQLNYGNIAVGTTTATVVIDSASPTRKLSGVRTTAISGPYTTEGTAAPFKSISITVAWREWGVTGTTSADSQKVNIGKWVSP